MPASATTAALTVADVMSRDVECLPADATVQDAAIAMAEYDVGAVLIGTAERLEGILTDRDILLRAIVDGRDTANLPVRDIMSSSLFTCHETDPVASAFEQMSEHQVRRLPVLDRNDSLVGIVALSDLTRLELDPRRAGAALRDLAEPHRLRNASPADDHP